MTSLIFGAVYLGHAAVVGHRREKQRIKNYERWEGLRDEYDEQRKTQRETRSLDLQRTGYDPAAYEDKPILTLRDQQEANDARTGWRPQESWTGTGSVKGQQQTGAGYGGGMGRRPASMDVGAAYGGQHNRAVSDMNGYSQHNAAGPGLGVQSTGYQQLQPSMRKLPAQTTGSVWDDGLPQPLRVSRQNFDDAITGGMGPGVGRSASLREYGSRGPPPSMTPRIVNGAMNGESSDNLSVPKRNGSSRSPSIPEERERPERLHHVDAIKNHVPGGRMAELIEGSGGMKISAPTSMPAHMEEWWKQRDGRTPAGEKDMQEWWK